MRVRLSVVAWRALNALTLSSVLTLASFGWAASPVQKGQVMPESKSSSDPIWSEVNRLLKEQKFNEALTRTQKILLDARASGAQKTVTEALVRATQYQTALHGYETAVQFLKNQAWPKDAGSQALLNLVYARSLADYFRATSWEIRRREKTAIAGARAVDDLKRWTADEIGSEISLAYENALSDSSVIVGDAPAPFKSFLIKNDYPVGVRPTLRDAIVYFAAEHLSDTSFWRPDQANEVYKLSFAKLADGSAVSGPQPFLLAFPQFISDAKLHPLLRLSALLHGHVAFHLSFKRSEAALEARYALLQHLWARANESREKEMLLTVLESWQKSPENRLHAWWSVGQAIHAGYLQLLQTSDSSSRPGRLAEALKVAQDGATAFRGTHGAERCEEIAKSILRPSMNLEIMASDLPNRASILVNHVNISKIYFRAYAFDVQAELKKAPAGQVWSWLEREGRSWKSLTAGSLGQPAASWDLAVQTSSDYASHRTYVTPPLRKAGAYWIVASVREDFAESQENAVVSAHMIVSDLVLQRSINNSGTEIRAVSSETGLPRAGVEISRYTRAEGDPWQLPLVKRETKESGSDGRVTFSPFGSYTPELYFANEKSRPDFAFFDRWDYHSVPQKSAGESYELFVFTDRSIYRPEQKLFWKISGFEGSRLDGKFRASAKRDVEVVLLDTNSQEVAKKTIKTNEFGTAAGEFQIPTGRALGSWRIRARFVGWWGVSDQAGWSNISVEEYKRPTFEATFQASEKPLRLNQSAKLKGEARYYFGLPVTAGRVSWRVKREPVSPWWWGGWRSRFAPGRGVSTAQVIAMGTAALNETGQFTIEFTPEADESARSNGVSYRFSIEADVTDEGGETRQAQKTVRLGFVSLEAKLEPSQGFFSEMAPVQVKATLTDLDGQGREGVGSWKLARLIEPKQSLLPADLPLPIEATKHSTPGDRKRPRWAGETDWQAFTQPWPEASVVAQGKAEHDKNGLCKIEVKSGLSAGVYRLSYEAKDEFGATLNVSQDFVVASERPGVAVPLILLADKSLYRVGEKAKILIASGLIKQPLTFEVHRAGQMIDRREIISGTVVEIPITENDRGGFTVSVVGLRDHQPLTAQKNLTVGWDNKNLAIELSTFRDKLRPGSKETFRLTIKDNNNKPLAAKTAEVLTYMFDRSLDFFGAHQTPRILSLYPIRTGWREPTYSISSVSGSVRSQFAFPGSIKTLSPDRLEIFSGYGVGGPGRRMLGKMARSKGESLNEGAPDGLAQEAMSMAAPPPAAAPAGREQLESKAKADVDSEVSKATQSDSPQGQGVQVRSDFSETAFWIPQLLTGPDGSISFEFQVPDSLTSWNFWVHALTKDMRFASLSAQSRSVKDLMVRPYVPRFFREGDEAAIKVQIDNASDGALAGSATFDIEDPETGKSVAAEFGLAAQDLKKSFTVAKAASTSLVFKVRAPKRVRTYAFRVIAQSGSLSDGELRAVPVLPSRMHLAQSRFVTLRNKDQKTMEFKDLAASANDPSLINDRLVVTIDAQLFYGVLQALPYLVAYPYECTEQTLNRFVSTGIVSSVFKKYPAIEKMALEMSKRETQFERFDGKDANSRMTLEESPWLVAAQGGGKAQDSLVNILDSRVARAERDRSLAKLRKAQRPSGGFPWFEGGPESEYITLYLTLGFARAAEFGVDVPKDMIASAWGYLKGWSDSSLKDCMSKKGCQELVTLLSFALSSYPDLSWTGGVFTEADKKRFLDYSFSAWKNHAPLLKGYLALSLKRAKRDKDAELVWASVMDSAKSTAELGTYWAPEDRSWLWYNDTIETHAFSLRTQMELAPKDKKNDGLVQWLFLNKKLSHWKSTRATAESIYALVHFLEKSSALGVREEVDVKVAGQTTKFSFAPDKYTGSKNQIVVEGAKVDPKTSAKIEVSKTTPGFAFASATWHYSTEKMPTEARGDFFSVSRKYFVRELKGAEWVLRPLVDGAQIKVGDQVEVQISLRTKHAAEYVHLRDPRGAGFEPESQVSGYKYDLGLFWYQEVRDSGANFFFNWLPVGEYTFKYRVRANMTGAFRVGPATVQSIYAPEFNAFSEGHVMRVADQ